MTIVHCVVRNHAMPSTLDSSSGFTGTPVVRKLYQTRSASGTIKKTGRITSSRYSNAISQHSQPLQAGGLAEPPRRISPASSFLHRAYDSPKARGTWTFASSAQQRPRVRARCPKNTPSIAPRLLPKLSVHTNSPTFRNPRSLWKNSVTLESKSICIR